MQVPGPGRQSRTGTAAQSRASCSRRDLSIVTGCCQGQRADRPGWQPWGSSEARAAMALAVVAALGCPWLPVVFQAALADALRARPLGRCALPTDWGGKGGGGVIAHI